MAEQPFYVILVEINEFKRVILNPKIVREETPELAVNKLLSKDPDEYQYVIQAFAFPVEGAQFKITRKFPRPRFSFTIKGVKPC